MSFGILFFVFVFLEVVGQLPVVGQNFIEGFNVLFCGDVGGIWE